MQLKDLLARLPPPLRSLTVKGKPNRYESTSASATQFHEPGVEEQRIPERFVHDIWASRLFDSTRLVTVDGQPVFVLDAGQQNHGSGPDFINSRIRIGDLDWRGDVEIHFRSSDWVAHRHQFDDRYNSVVLHVSFVEDFWTGRLQRPDGSAIPEVVLRPAIAIPLRRMLVTLNARAESQPHCLESWSSVPGELQQGWITRLGLEKVREKKSLLSKQLPAAGTLDELIYRELMRGMGYSKNTDAFFDLACRVPLALLRQSTNFRLHEALLFGAAGLSRKGRPFSSKSDQDDPYQISLRTHFETINSRLQIPEMSPLTFEFFRLRPGNFPTLRIAQAASWFGVDGLLHERTADQILNAARTATPIRSLRSILGAKPSPYWRTHYRFGRTTAAMDRPIGNRRIDSLINNTIVPFLLLISEQTGEQQLANTASAIATQLPVVSTEVTRMFSAAGFRCQSAADAHGVHQLFRTRCQQSGCLSCPIGRHILRADIKRSTTSS